MHETKETIFTYHFSTHLIPPNSRNSVDPMVISWFHCHSSPIYANDVIEKNSAMKRNGKKNNDIKSIAITQFVVFALSYVKYLLINLATDERRNGIGWRNDSNNNNHTSQRQSRRKNVSKILINANHHMHWMCRNVLFFSCAKQFRENNISFRSHLMDENKLFNVIMCTIYLFFGCIHFAMAHCLSNKRPYAITFC